ncbi:MAG: hypothetical protein AABX74_04920 [Nanoarchaeota archaeon]
MKRGINSLIAAVIFLIFSVYAFAAGGGGGGGSSSGLGFSSSRDSIFILVNQDYSAKFSLKNNTKYALEVNVDDGNVTVNFGSYYFELKEGDNFADLNQNGLADINFKLESIKGSRADIRIINVKDQISVEKEETIITDESKKEAKETDEQIGEIKCANLKTIKERVSCRLDLEKEEQEEELQLYYLPEECAALSGASRGICIARYKSVQTCWKFPVGAERVSCAKRAIRLGTIQEEKEKCDALKGENKSVCVREIKNKNYDLIKWHFYELEDRAEDFMMRGLADKESVVDFIVKTEENKVKFNEADSKEERKNIILDVRNNWKELVKKIIENAGR